MTAEDIEFFDTCFYFNRRLLTMIGICSDNPKPVFFLNFIVNLFFITGFILQMNKFLADSSILDKTINFLQDVVPGLCTLVCYNGVILEYETTLELHNRMVFYITYMEQEQERMIFRKYISINKIATCTILILLIGYSVLMVSPSIFYAIHLFNETLNNTRIVLPITGANLINTKMHYYEMLLYQCLLLFIVPIVASAVYASYVLLIQHACFLLTVVKMKIRTPYFEDPYNTKFHGSAAEYDWLIEIVRSYIKTAEFVKLLNILSERVYLIQVLGAMLILVLSFLYLSDMYISETKNVAEIAKCGIYSATLTSIAYVNCYLGQVLIDRSTAVINELRQISFYKFPTKVQKLLPMVILRCTKPCTLLIGGMFVSSHEFFSGLVQTSISYYMVCRAIR